MKPLEKMSAFVNGLGVMAVFAIVILYFPAVGSASRQADTWRPPQPEANTPAMVDAAAPAPAKPLSQELNAVGTAAAPARPLQTSELGV